MTVHFYVDEDLLGLAKLLCRVRTDVTYPGDPGDSSRPPCAIQPRTADRVWIPRVAEQGWIVISHDRHIRSRPDEQAAVRGSHARHVTLAGKNALGLWGQLEIVVTQWRRIEKLAELSGPWIYSVGRASLKQVL